jgi:hypothetical protein
MRLSEFRRLGFADRLDGQPQLVCTGDQLPPARSIITFSDVRPTRLTEITGVTSCVWFRAVSGGGVTTWLRSNLLAGGFPTERQVFEFASIDAGQEPVLFSISMEVRPDGKQAVAEGLQGRFGLPDSVHPQGAVLSAGLMRWSDGDQEVTLSDMSMLRLAYTLRPIADVVQQRKQAAFGSSASSL